MTVPGATEITSLCQDESQRVEPFGLIATGRLDGGTFAARCGKADSGSSWPPDVVMGCHAGIVRQPGAGNSMVAPVGNTTSTSISTWFPHPEGSHLITSVDSQIRIIPFAWDTMAPAPFNSSGWDTWVSEGTGPGNVPHSMVDLDMLADPLGLEVCPHHSDEMVPPVFITRITGQTDQGPFTSEAFVDICTRAPPP